MTEPLPSAGSENLPDLVGGLLDAVGAMDSAGELSDVLRRVVRLARQLTGARYAALGVLSQTAALVGGRRLDDFVTDGLGAEEVERIGALPQGHGVLGVLIDDPQPLRLDEIAAHPASVGFPAGHPPMGRFLGVPIRIRDAVFGNFYLADKADGTDFGEAEVVLVTRLAEAAAVAVENARLLADSRDHQRWSAAAAELIPELVKDLTQAPTLVARTLVQTGDCDAAGVALSEADVLSGLVAGTDLSAATGLVVRRVAGAGESLLGRVIDHPGRARVLEEQEQQRVLGLSGGSSVVVACRTADRVLGALVLHRTWGGWSPAELRIVDSFATDIARAVEHARLEHNWQLLAVYTDRDRIARDLHDETIQRIYAVGLGLQGTLARVGDVDVRRRLQQHVAELDATIDQIRSTIFALNAEQQPGGGLAAAATVLVRDSAALLGFAPELETRGELDERVPAPLAADALAVLREGLANVARHAAASRVAVRLVAEPADGLLIEITDDGVGPGITARPTGLGLAHLRARAAAGGGSLELSAPAAGGALLRWRVPLPRTP